MSDKSNPTPASEQSKAPTIKPLPLATPPGLEELGEGGLVCDPATGVCTIATKQPPKPKA